MIDCSCTDEQEKEKKRERERARTTSTSFVIFRGSFLMCFLFFSPNIGMFINDERRHRYKLIDNSVIIMRLI